MGQVNRLVNTVILNIGNRRMQVKDKAFCMAWDKTTTLLIWILCMNLIRWKYNEAVMFSACPHALFPKLANRLQWKLVLNIYINSCHANFIFVHTASIHLLLYMKHKWDFTIFSKTYHTNTNWYKAQIQISLGSATFIVNTFGYGECLR